MKYWILSMVLLMGAASSSGVVILMDYSDGGSDGFHDVAVRDGGFENVVDSALHDARTYAEMPDWDNLTGLDTKTLGRTNLALSTYGPRNAVISEGRTPGQNMGHTIQSGDIFQGSMMWRDSGSWDADDQIKVILFYTSDNTLTGAATDLMTWNSGPRTGVETWEKKTFPSTGFVDALAVGKTLMVRFEVEAEDLHFARMDDLYLEVTSNGEPQPSELLLTNLMRSAGTVTVEWNQLTDRYILVASGVLDGMRTNGLTVASGTVPAQSASFSYEAETGFFQLIRNIAALENIISPVLVSAVKEQSTVLAPSNKVYDAEVESIVSLQLSESAFSIGELTYFPHLKSLDLKGVGLTGLGSLSSLSSIQWLNLSSNAFASASLPALPAQVEALQLEANQLTDLSMMEPLVHLRWLDLEDNQLTDLSSLVTNAANGGLGDGDEVWVRGNPLGATALTQISILQSTYNVKVVYE